MMDVRMRLPGGACDEEDGVLRILVPIEFTEISTTYRPKVDIVVDSVTDEQGLQLAVSRPRVYRRVGISPDDLLENKELRQQAEIRSRPVDLRGDEGDNNELWMGVFLRSKGTLPRSGGLNVRLSLYFSTSNRVECELQLEYALGADGLSSQVVVNSFERLEGSHRALVNLLMVLTGVGAVAAWNFLYNGDVHERPVWLDGRVISLLLGIALGFLTLSVSRLRSWVKTLAHFQGVLRFPEAHLHPSTFDFLNHRRSTFLLGAVALMLVTLTGGLFSVPITQVQVANNYRIVDLPHEAEVTTDRLFAFKTWFDGSEDEPHYAVSCAEEPRMAPVLARLRLGPRSRVAEWSRFKLIYPAYVRWEKSRSAEDTPFAEVVTGDSILRLSFSERPEVEDALRSFFCGNEDDSGIEVEIERLREADPDSAQWLVRIETDPHAELIALQAAMTTYRETTLRQFHEVDLWMKRDELVDGAYRKLSDVPGHKHPNDLFELADDLWTDIEVESGYVPNAEKALARAFEARAAMRHIKGRVTEDALHLLLEAYRDRFHEVVGAVGEERTSWRVARALWEVLLELEKERPAYAEQIHHAIVGDTTTWSRWRGDVALQYLRAALRMEVLAPGSAIEGARRAFFADRRRVMEITANNDIPLYIANNEVPFGARYADPDERQALLTLLNDLWSPQVSSTGM